MLNTMELRNFPFNDLTLFAHPTEAGETVEFKGKTYTLQAIEDGCFDDLDIALFSAGGGISREWAPKAVEAGCIVVDNSSEFRMDENTPLVVPEVNGHAVARHNGIIANPNCTTIIMNVPVFPLHKMAGVKRAVVSTYQAASGAGLLAMQELEQQAKDFAAGEPLTQDIFGRQYLWNLFSHNSPIYAVRLSPDPPPPPPPPAPRPGAAAADAARTRDRAGLCLRAAAALQLCRRRSALAQPTATDAPLVHCRTRATTRRSGRWLRRPPRSSRTTSASR